MLLQNRTARAQYKIGKKFIPTADFSMFWDSAPYRGFKKTLFPLKRV
jgi:hypothetical protein